MRMLTRVLAVFVPLLFLATGVAQAQAKPVDLGNDPALAIAGPDLAPGDARVVQARAWLAQVVKATGETEEQVAASCIKLSRFLFDALRVRALPMEALEGLTVQLAPGKSLGDMTAAYFQARRDASDKSHAAALTALAKR